MAFRGRIVRISQLTADKIIGAFIATGLTGVRWEINATTGTSDVADITGLTGDANETAPALIEVYARRFLGFPFNVSTLGLKIVGQAWGALGHRASILIETTVADHPSIVLDAWKLLLEHNSQGAGIQNFVQIDDAGVAISADSGVSLTSPLGVLFNGAGAALKGLAFGQTSITILTGDLNASKLVAHGLGVVPVAVMAIASGISTVFCYQAGAPNSTNVNLGVRFYEPVAAGSNTVVTVHWIAFR